MSKDNIKSWARLIATGFTQVTLVSINTWQISNGKFAGAIFVGFLISLVWTLNVKSIAFGGWRERFVYSGAAAMGTCFGMMVPHLLYQF